MTRARDLGIPFEGDTGSLNAITDVAGVRVGHTTLIQGEGALEVGRGPIRTGVTAILPRGEVNAPVFAGWYTLNGNGEMTGTTWVEESGFLEGPVMLTNTHSVGVVRDAVVSWMVDQRAQHGRMPGPFWSLPVVAETYDGGLNDINGFHIQRRHVYDALENASTGPVTEGNAGGGTGMICHDFKGGIGTSSRCLSNENGGYTVGVLVQANHGDRKNLLIAGVPVGREIPDLLPDDDAPVPAPGTGSIIVTVATDAPLLPHQLKRLTRRVPLGIARVGGMGAHGSGDIFIAFSTANSGAGGNEEPVTIDMLPNQHMTPLFEATIFATEEAIVNAMIAAETMIGIDNTIVYALPHERLQTILHEWHRPATGPGAAS